LKLKIEAIFLLGLVLSSSSLSAQLTKDPVGKYAFSGIEKVCLNVYDQNRFELFTSSCTFDYHHKGNYSTKGDTLILNSDVKPRISLIKAETAKGDRQGCQLNVSSDDPLMLRNIRLVADGRTYKFDGSGFGVAPQSPKKITLYIDGLAPLVYESESIYNTMINLIIGFEDLTTPYLQDDKWLVAGRKLNHVPKPNIKYAEEVVVKKGKRCWYHKQFGN
jgi:hypothetical protein